MVDKIDTTTIPTLIILGNRPFSLVIHVKYAKIGEQKAKIVQPTIKTLLYTPLVM